LNTIPYKSTVCYTVAIKLSLSEVFEMTPEASNGGERQSLQRRAVDIVKCVGAWVMTPYVDAEANAPVASQDTSTGKVALPEGYQAPTPIERKPPAEKYPGLRLVVDD
jgi:hypothetical protein